MQHFYKQSYALQLHFSTLRACDYIILARQGHACPKHWQARSYILARQGRATTRHRYKAPQGGATTFINYIYWRPYFAE